MADTAKIELIVLYEEEIRKAAIMLDQLFKIKDEEFTNEEESKMFVDAVNACRVALYHPGLMVGSSIVMLTSKAAFKAK